MPIWFTLTNFWLHHDILFTKFGLYSNWVHWNIHHFSSIAGIRHWFLAHHQRNGHALWAWCNLNG
jgi:uncharacterized membrane protein